jgi:hypothetical protein
MFKKQPAYTDKQLEVAIDRIYSDMETNATDSPEYITLMTNLSKLTALRVPTKDRRPSADTLAVVMGNIMGILVIVAYEQKHAMTSKGLNFILKTK